MEPLGMLHIGHRLAIQWLVSVVVCVNLGALHAAEPAPPTDWKEIDAPWRVPLDRAVAFIADLSVGEFEEAWQKYRIMLPEVPKPPPSPFDPDPFDHFLKQMQKFPPGAESLSLVAERRYSEKSRRFYFIADTKYGPVLIEMLIFRHNEEWYFGHFGYLLVASGDANWHKLYDDVVPAMKRPVPIVVAWPQRPVAAESPTP